MALKLNDGTVLRNLEEQVLKNKEDIAAHYNIDRVLADFGIKVIGQVASAADLPNPETYQGDYGDAYAVGAKDPYSFYIWTRADIDAGHPADYWFDIGPLAIIGPRGAKGDKGDKGETGQSTQWYVGNPGSFSSAAKEGDLLLYWGPGDALDYGNVFQRQGTSWKLKCNIRGPQGIQGLRGLQGEKGEKGDTGPRGPQGDVGGFINIWGILTDAAQLPLPTSLNNLTVAYLVEHTGGTDQANDHYDLYVQVGSTSSTATWNNVGPFNAATLVTEGGIGLNVWDADTKLDKPTIVSGAEVTVTYNPNSKTTDYRQIGFSTDANTKGFSVLITDSQGRLSANDPVNPKNLVNLQYLNEQLSTKSHKSTYGTWTLTDASSGSKIYFPIVSLKPSFDIRGAFSTQITETEGYDIFLSSGWTLIDPTSPDELNYMGYLLDDYGAKVPTLFTFYLSENEAFVNEEQDYFTLHLSPEYQEDIPIEVFLSEPEGAGWVIEESLV